MKTRNLVSLSVLGALAFGGMTPQIASARPIKQVEKVSVAPGRSLTPAQEMALSRSAVRVLRHIADARSDIADKNAKLAKSDLVLAQLLLEDIKLNMPTTIVKDKIKIAKEHMKYESVDEVSSDLVPIDASLTAIEDYVPVAESKRHIKEAQKHLQKNDKKAATEELEAADIALVYTEVDLPLSSTETHIKNALTALGKKKFKDADKALVEAEDGVMFLTNVVDAPITQAKHHIWRAAQLYSAKEFGKAKSELDKAGNYLSRAAKSSDKKTKAEAGKLKTDVDDLGRKIDSGSHADMSDMKGVLRRSKALADREAEKVSVGWENHRENKALKADLIDAKLHLNKAMSYADAESYKTSSALTSDVEVELDQAQDYLDRAKSSTDKDIARKAKKWSADIKSARARLNNGEKEALTDYQDVIAEMRTEIQKL